MLTIDNREIEKAEPLGNFILCTHCGERHIIKYGEIVKDDGTRIKAGLTYYKCNEKTYLAGIKGKDIRRP